MQLEYHLRHIERTFLKNLKAAGVLDLWFEPVYEEGFKVGDWITVTKITSYGWLQDTDIRTFKITNLPTEYHGGTFYTVISSCGTRGGGLHGEFRLATAEEIKDAQYVVKLKFGDTYWDISKEHGVASFVHGVVNKQKIKELVDYLTGISMPNVLGKKLFLDPQTKIKFGCQIGTIEQLLNIYNKLK